MAATKPADHPINSRDASAANGEGAPSRSMNGDGEDDQTFRFRPFPQQEALDSGADAKGPLGAFATPQPMARGSYPSPYPRPEAGSYGTDPRKITRTRRASAMRNTNTPYSRPASMQRGRVTFQDTADGSGDLGPSRREGGSHSGLRSVPESAVEASGALSSGAGVARHQQGAGPGSSSGVPPGSPGSGWLASWGRAVRGLIGWQARVEAPKVAPSRGAQGSQGERRGGVPQAEGRVEATGAGQAAEEEALFQKKTLSMAEYERLDEMLRSRLVQEEDRMPYQGSGQGSGKLGSSFEQRGQAGSGTPGVQMTPRQGRVQGQGQGVFGAPASPWGTGSERGSRRDSLATTTSDQFFTPPDKAPPLSPAEVAKAFMGVRPHTPVAPAPSPLAHPGPRPSAVATTPQRLPGGSARPTSSPIVTSPAPTPAIASPGSSQWGPHSPVYQGDEAYEGAHQGAVRASARQSGRPSRRSSYMSVEEVDGEEELAAQQQQQLGPYLGAPEQGYHGADMQLVAHEPERGLPITRWTPLLTAGQGTKRRVSALEVESWQGIGVGPMRRVRQRASEFGGHGFPARASASSHRPSAAFRPPASDSLYLQQDTVQGTAGQALGPFVPGRSMGLGTSGVPGVLGRRRPLLRRAPRRTGLAQGSQEWRDGALASGAAGQLPAGGAAAGAQGKGPGAGGGADGGPMPFGAKAQKAAEEVSARSSHLAQKILDAIDYRASPGVPKASFIGGAGFSTPAGSSGAGRGALGLEGAGVQGGGLRLGEGELNDRVRRSMAAAEQPPPMPPSAFTEGTAGVPGATVGTGGAPAGTPVEAPGSSQSKKPRAGFRIRFEDDEGDVSEPSPAAFGAPSSTPFSFPHPSGATSTPVAGTETPRLPRPVFGAAPSTAPAAAAAAATGVVGAGASGEKQQEQGPGGFFSSKPPTPAGPSGTGAGTGRGAATGAGQGFTGDVGDRVGTPGGFSFGGQPGKSGAEGGFSFRGESPEAGADAAPPKRRESGTYEKDATTAPQHTQTPSFSFAASPASGSSSKPTAGGAPQFAFGTPGRDTAGADTGAGVPGAAQPAGGETEGGAFRAPGSSGGVSGPSPGAAGAGPAGAVGADGVSTMAGLSSSSALGGFAQAEAGAVFGATGKGFNFSSQFGSAQGSGAKGGSPASGQQGSSQGKENLERGGSWARERDESDAPAAKRAAKRGFREEAEEGEVGGGRRKRGAEEEEGQEDGEIQPAWGSKAKVSWAASGSSPSAAGPSPGAATAVAAATPSTSPAFSFGLKGTGTSTTSSPAPLLFGSGPPSAASPAAASGSQPQGEASKPSASGPGFAFGAGAGTGTSAGSAGGAPSGAPLTFGAAPTTPSASSSQAASAPAFLFGAPSPSGAGTPSAEAGATKGAGSGLQASDATAGAGAGFKFGAGGVSFGLATPGAASASAPSAASAPASTPAAASTPSFAFGASGSSAAGAAGFAFGAATPGGPTSSAPAAASSGAASTPASPSTVFAFGAQGTGAGADAGAGKPAGAAPSFVFGVSPSGAAASTSGSAAASSLFGSSSSSPVPFTFGGQPSAASGAASQAQPSPAVFGAAPTFGGTPASGTAGGASGAGAPLFGAAPGGAGSSAGTQAPFVFGGGGSTPGGGAAPTSPGSVFTFGSTGTPSGGAPASTPAGTAPFTFGGAAAAGTPGAAGGGAAASSPAPFTFGSTPAPAAAAGGAPFQFGSPAPSATPAFSFAFGAKPGAPAAPSPVFGAPNGAVQFGGVMDDNSMNDEMGGGGGNAGQQQQQQQQASPGFSAFGAQATPQAGAFGFGSQPQVMFGSPAPAQGAAPFGGFGAGASPNPFGQQTPPQGLQPAGAPVFSAGAGGAATPGGFSLGASDSKRRPFMKAKKPLSRRK